MQCWLFSRHSLFLTFKQQLQNRKLNYGTMFLEESLCLNLECEVFLQRPQGQKHVHWAGGPWVWVLTSHSYMILWGLTFNILILPHCFIWLWKKQNEMLQNTELPKFSMTATEGSPGFTLTPPYYSHSLPGALGIILEQVVNSTVGDQKSLRENNKAPWRIVSPLSLSFGSRFQSLLCSISIT